MMRFCYKRNRSSTTTLCIGELTHARTIILRTIQKIDFACEYKQLVAHKAVDKKSALVSLFPMIGKDSLIRVGGKLEESIWIHHKLRGKRPDKAYTAVFCCFATKAVHLELVSDLTTDAFLGALRRFLSRCGRCQTIHCDNATNFVGANNKLKALEEAIFTDKAQAQIIHHCNQRQVDFKFIPPRAPSFGGLWEAAVKSAKRLLVSVTATASLTFEELNTVIVEVEAILNSRPITPMSSDPTDVSALTPGHFLIGEPLTAPPDVNLSPNNKTLVKRWELVSRLKHPFWKQWSMEYLQELQMRNKWKTMSQNVKEGLLVLIKEDNLPVMSWPMGKIVKTYPGRDNYVRVVDVKTASRVSLTRLAPLLKEEVSTKRSNISIEGAIVSEEINQPGIFYERLGTARTAASEWTIIAYYDLKPYWCDMNILSTGIKELRHKCSELHNENSCNSIVTHFQHVYEELQEGSYLINHSRQRRSPLDVAGTVANSLFGVLDARYAVDMAKVINEVKSKEDVLMMLLKNQTSILDSTINIVRKSKSSTDNRIRNLERQLATINKERGRYQGDLLQQAFVILTAQLTLLATGMQRMQAEIASVFTDVRHRTISPMLITPKQLRDQLDKIRDHLLPDQMLPVSSENVMELYKIMRAEGTTTTDHVIFKMTVPLVSTAQQEVFSIIPIPTWHSGGWNRFDIKTPIIAVNSHRDQFIGLTEAIQQQI
ncbi:uncharacterized protein [Drosophila takahashii]|uniref:uncharacterized protein n=1 Tax=Drosophila takahashii TaxID=29030 RepID=UPI003898D77D